MGADKLANPNEVREKLLELSVAGEVGVYHDVSDIHSFSLGKQIDQIIDQVKKLDGLKFYEFDDPYYSLVKAKDEKDAIEEYEHATADNPEGVREIDIFTALLLFSRSVSEDGNQVPIIKILNDFFRNERTTLIYDRHLL
ncbi:hypothetical protein [Bacillus licheniformis]|uniref:hypothetical protein n=1 Tax=Bacillus licheniformis TaxID=1402 RepID=UPI001114D8A6|nr:hypothetical protein [Bacillus licheniformis]GIN25614.1 hypothetical protein J31TS2_21940 [Bacillus licheniformis]GIN29647.1 hypothetical protein J2TS5_16860 [Bacillus licheniformis]